MKHSIYSALALVLVAARAVAADVEYASVKPTTQTSTFSDLGMDQGNNYMACPFMTTALGLATAGSYIQSISLLCGEIYAGNQSTLSYPDVTMFPIRGYPDSFKNRGRWLGGDNPQYNTCPDGQMVAGVSCTGNDCTNMAIYCAAATNYTPVHTPHMTPKDDDPASLVSRDKCGWTDLIGTDSIAACPPNKVLSGLMCMGKRCNLIGLYCCPVIVGN